MKSLYIIIFLLILSFSYGCDKSVNDNDKSDSQLINIHFGTRHNSLRGVTVTWQSNIEANNIKWGYTSNYEFGEFKAKLREYSYKDFFDFTFPVLKPLSEVHYSIKMDDKWSDDKTFQTSVDTLSNKFSFAVGGDSHAGDSENTDSRWQTISSIIANKNINFFIHLGDAVDDNDSWKEWDSYFGNGKSLLEQELVYYTWGNHEYGDIAINNVILPENKKWYSFTQGNALFISLLSEEDFDVQYNWLVNVLKNTDKEWIIVYFHHPFFTRGSHSHEMDDYRETWWRAFDEYGVDIVMSGHTHSYIRTTPLNLNLSDSLSVKEYGSKQNQGRLEFVSGGLGGKNSSASEEWFTASAFSGMHFIKIDINENSLHFEVHSTDEVIVDSLTLFSEGLPISN